jgi:hypothetical protein
MAHHVKQDNKDAESGKPVELDREHEQKGDKDKQQPPRPDMPKPGQPQHQGGQHQQGGSNR